jgi:hypothetical protein
VGHDVFEHLQFANQFEAGFSARNPHEEYDSFTAVYTRKNNAWPDPPAGGRGSRIKVQNSTLFTPLPSAGMTLHLQLTLSTQKPAGAIR